MADNYLITGYWGEPHVTAENDRGINAGIVGAGRFVLPVGEQFRAEYIGNNTIRVYDGKLLDNGAAAGIPAGEYVDLLIANAGQSMKRNDLIVFQYIRDASTLIETGTFIVVQGTEGSTASDPELEQEDLLSGNASKDQFPLWRIPVDNANIGEPEQMFEVSNNLAGGSSNALDFGKSIQYGSGGGVDVNSSSYTDVEIIFDTPFSSEPVVMCVIESYSDSAKIGLVNAAVCGGSVTTTGFTIRIYNADTSKRSPSYRWLAIGMVEE